MNDNINHLSGEDAAKIRTAAKEAIKSIPGAALGDGDIDGIIRLIGGDNRSLADRMALASNLAKGMVDAQGAKPINFSSSTPEEIARWRAMMGLHMFGKGGHPFGPQGSDPNPPNGSAGSNGGTGIGTKLGSSGAYARAFPGADPAFLHSIGLNSATGGELAHMGFTSRAQVKELVHDAANLGVEKNRGTIALAKMKSDDPTHYASHMNFFKGEFKHGLDCIKQMDSQIEHERDPAKKAALIKQRDEVKEKLEAARLKERAKSDGHPICQKGFDDISNMMRKNSEYRHDHKNDGARHSSDDEQKKAKAGAGLNPAGTHAQNKIARKADASSTNQVASGADDIFGKADDPKVAPPPKVAEKPKPTKVAAKGSAPSVA